MRLFALAALSLALLCPQRTLPQAAKSTMETDLVACANEWTAAINRKDGTKLDEIMSPEFALYGWNGKLRAPRSVWLDNLFSHMKIERNTLTDPAPQIYGDFTIVTSKADWIESFDGRRFNQKCLVVDTWRIFNGQWKVVNRTSDCTDQ